MHDLPTDSHKENCMPNEASLNTWMPTIARSLAFLCLQTEEGKKATSILAKAELLLTLGLRIDDAAALTGSSVQSIRVLQSQRRSKARTNGKAKKNRRKSK
jgi:hypothetical protein